MRTFVAIELPKEIKDSLARLQERLRRSGADVKWVEPENIHLTLKFLGERDDKKIEKIKGILEDTCSKNPKFSARISLLGAFPKIEFPRVIWVGIEKGDEEVKRIAACLEENIARVGIPKEERPFSSHITLGRVRTSLNKEGLAQELIRLKESLSAERLEFNVTKITLFKSTLTSKGPIYEAIKEVNLATT